MLHIGVNRNAKRVHAHANCIRKRCINVDFATFVLKFIIFELYKIYFMIKQTHDISNSISAKIRFIFFNKAYTGYTKFSRKCTFDSDELFWKHFHVYEKNHLFFRPCVINACNILKTIVFY